MGTLGKRVRREPPWVQIPYPPRAATVPGWTRHRWTAATMDRQRRRPTGHERSWRAAAGLIGVLVVLAVVVWLLSLTSDGAGPVERPRRRPRRRGALHSADHDQPAARDRGSTEAVPGGRRARRRCSRRAVQPAGGPADVPERPPCGLAGPGDGSPATLSTDRAVRVTSSNSPPWSCSPTASARWACPWADDPPSAVLVTSGAELVPSDPAAHRLLGDQPPRRARRRHPDECLAGLRRPHRRAAGASGLRGGGGPQRRVCW